MKYNNPSKTTFMNSDQVSKPFNKRAFIANTMFFSAVLLPFSGYMNHRLQLELITGSRHFWMSVHDMAAILFTISVVIHVYYNLHSLIKYINKAKNIKISREAIAAILIVLVIVGLFSTHALHTS